MEQTESEIRRVALEVVALEIQKQVEPLQREIKMLVQYKTQLLRDMKALKDWSKELWGNGSGTPGYLEKARAEDDKRYQELLQMASGSAAQLKVYEVERTKAEGVKEYLEALAKTRKTRVAITAALVSIAASLGLFKLVPLIMKFFSR